ncbi:hypothetical protein A3D42_01515 [Candidatus Nomurabacteria bacterium RIFCSPHIGHO2_02_FULL_41_18]|uniref:Uncharacterized protein n=1 Tax=Candidatus Nomurabacteria bacterium RIFCSPHIGHO2_02_FULL_41_18 TaxID=1801754 RepID=A0A1F6W7E9_9BACT|nr:MAG: hypothetical protein A2737_00280 [Candidatus Nomurabacteria bacterium RIFCSPHIGHO2_01_FULL_41_71]OGI77870.1 MAG: hypothetical protein A3D42_01515 [Candidatus Nomurabacteria bacterium RIFCSPHIGHO2_02_FULL_41_18]OGI90025.1 MAG: hypothetical protein A3B01_02110 [Candidatus Nomurabacteria bacterium RIFCSPLOWO2_01_FULL_41_52b]OGJ00103.1 MAG: hypothetical protein A3I90_01140 [Candidatus Nomurabacteria bacterium RIFCSPLOWO2_02_FULL_41_9]
MKFGEKIKQKIWHFIYKFFPTIQKELLKLHLIWHQRGRQKYHIGYLKPGKTLEELKNHLHDEWGFGNHFVAWSDDSQVLSWRKLSDFYHQYHLRIFSDGEIRGHFEYTPEGHPIAHFDEKGESFHHAEFLKFLGDFVTDKRHPMHLRADPNAYNPDSEISMEKLQKS